MPRFALIGERLSHSYSKLIHDMFSAYDYELVELKKTQLLGFVKDNRYDGFNVTIPYKEEIIKYLDELDESAKAVQSVNTVVKCGGRTVGYNTDIGGLFYLLNDNNIFLRDKKILILGSGGTSKTAQALAKAQMAKAITVISRTGQNNYQNVDSFYDYEIIINTTPVGMYPNNLDRLIDITRFSSLEAVVDVIYNPFITGIMFDAKKRGIKAVSALKMLVAQAKLAKDLFCQSRASDAIIEEVYKKIYSDTLNIVLVGMPSSGKSVIGKALALSLQREFIDIDKSIEENQNMSIPKIFETKGEEYFRQAEKEILVKVCKEKAKVIATGGGAVTIKDIYPVLKQNSVIVYLTRDAKYLETSGRPLLSDTNAYNRLLAKRLPLYEDYSDIEIENNSEIEQVVDIIRRRFSEYIGN